MTQGIQSISVGRFEIGPRAPLAIIAGPCVAESLDMCLHVGRTLRDRCGELGFNFIFKASFDKANRSSILSDRGPGMNEGLNLLGKVKDRLGVPVTTDVHEPDQAADAATIVDILQVPAFLCRQTDLLVACAKTGRAVNVKKGQFVSPDEMSSVVDKLLQAKKQAELHTPACIMLTERGTFFGYNRLVNDFLGLGDLMDLGWPVCFDVTHSTQLPGASRAGDAKITGGRPDRAPMLARCAVAAGVQALFIETHPDPARGKSDSATMLPLDVTVKLLGDLAILRRTMEQIDAAGTSNAFDPH